MPFQMQPARQLGSAGDVPDVGTLLAASLTASKGQVVKNSSGTAIIHPLGSDVLLVYGVTLEADVSGTSDGPDSTLLHIARADVRTEFVSKVTDSAGVIQTDLSGLSVGDQLGILTTSSQDYVDKDDTTDKLVQLTKIDDDLDVVWFVFIPATLDPAQY